MAAEPTEQLALLRSWVEFSACAHFFRLFYSGFGPDHFDTYRFEDALLATSLEAAAWLEALNIKVPNL